MTATQPKTALSPAGSDATESETAIRTSIAREIHDNIAQDVRVALMMLESMSLEGTSVTAPGQSPDVQALLRGALRKMQGIAGNLRPDPDRQDLFRALNLYLQNAFLNELTPLIRQRGATCRLNVVVANEVYLIAVEAVRNAAQHARGANRVYVDLLWRVTDLVVTVSDDGHRFSPSAREQHLGLQGMRERAALVGGLFDVTSSARGTRVTVLVPYERATS